MLDLDEIILCEYFHILEYKYYTEDFIDGFTAGDFEFETEKYLAAHKHSIMKDDLLKFELIDNIANYNADENYRLFFYCWKYKARKITNRIGDVNSDIKNTFNARELVRIYNEEKMGKKFILDMCKRNVVFMAYIYNCAYDELWHAVKNIPCKYMELVKAILDMPDDEYHYSYKDMEEILNDLGLEIRRKNGIIARQ